MFSEVSRSRNGTTSTSGLSASIVPARRVGLRLAERVGRVGDLALEVRLVDDVGVDDPERADAGGGEVERGGRAEAAGADQQDARVEQLQLALLADLGDQQVAAVARRALGPERARQVGRRSRCASSRCSRRRARRPLVAELGRASSRRRPSGCRPRSRAARGASGRARRLRSATRGSRAGRAPRRGCGPAPTRRARGRRRAPARRRRRAAPARARASTSSIAARPLQQVAVARHAFNCIAGTRSGRERDGYRRAHELAGPRLLRSSRSRRSSPRASSWSASSRREATSRPPRSRARATRRSRSTSACAPTPRRARSPRAAALRRTSRTAGGGRSSAATARSRRRSARRSRRGPTAVDRAARAARGRAAAQRAGRRSTSGSRSTGPPRRARRWPPGGPRASASRTRRTRCARTTSSTRSTRPACRASCRRSRRRCGSACSRPARQLAALRRAAARGDAHAKILYGTALQQLGRPLSAERQFAAAARLAPNDPEARVAAAVGLFDKDDPARAFGRLGPLVARLPARPDRPLPPRPDAALVGAGRGGPQAAQAGRGERRRTRSSAAGRAVPGGSATALGPADRN